MFFRLIISNDTTLIVFDATGNNTRLP